MRRAEFSLSRAQRRDGPAVRKLPTACEDFLGMRRSLSSDNINSNFAFCVVAIECFFMVRRIEYIGTGVERGAYVQKFR